MWVIETNDGFFTDDRGIDCSILNAMKFSSATSANEQLLAMLKNGIDTPIIDAWAKEYPIDELFFTEPVVGEVWFDQATSEIFLVADPEGDIDVYVYTVRRDSGAYDERHFAPSEWQRRMKTMKRIEVK